MTAIIAGGGKEEKSGSEFSARGMPTISPTAHSQQAYQVSRVASSTGAQNAQKICAFSPNWVFFFCQNWIFSAEEFLRCHCSICQKSQNRDQFQFFFRRNSPEKLIKVLCHRRFALSNLPIYNCNIQCILYMAALSMSEKYLQGD